MRNKERFARQQAPGRCSAGRRKKQPEEQETVKGGGREAGGDPRPGGKKRAVKGGPGDSVKGDVTLRRVHRLE